MATGSIAGGTVGAADVGTIYVAGDVVWAEVKSYPWWPAVISEHEEGDKHCPHFRTFKKQYHLQFLGPYIEHQWLSARHLVPYKGADRYKDLASSYGNRPKHEIPKRFVKAWDLAVKEANVYVKERTSERRTEMLIAKLTHAQEEACKEKESEEEQILTACVFQSHTFLLNKKSLSMVENRLAELSSKNKKLKLKIEKFKMSASEAETLKQLSLDPESIIHITTTNKNEKYDKFAKVKTGPDSHMASSEATLKRSRLENVSSNTFDNAHSSSPVKKRLKLQNSDQVKELLIDAAVVDAIQKNGNKLKAVLKNHRKILENVLDEILNCNGVRRKNSENELHQQAVKRKAKQLLTLAEAARFLGESGQSPIKRSLDKIERQLQKEKQLRGETENSSTPLSSKKLQDLLSEEPPKPVDPLKPLYSDPLLKEKVCIKCETDGKSLICCIQCCNAYHVKCLDEKEVQSIDPSIGFTCMKCITGEKKCFSCKDSLANVDETSVFRCAVTNCKKFYHAKCLDKYPGLKDLTSSPEKRKNTCPQHFCASCYPHDTADNKVCYHGKIIKCLKCPVAYHSKSEDRCFPAGSVIINGYNLICPLHFPSKRSHKIRVNINWCFFCGIGGDLILCETCPAAFHLKCVKLEEKPAEGRTWSCENCSAGLVPRYNDIVWVKCGVYRWWPARIVDPEQIPDNILRQFHEDGNFVVQFFGSHDYMWTGVGRVFLYEENDKANRDSKSTSLSQSFVRGLTEASEAFRQLTIQRRENFCTKLYKSQNGSKPAPYKYVTHNIPQGDVKVMKADLDTYEVCRCRKTDPDPCGPSSGCENRMTFIECHPKLCHAGERCQNQKFAKAEYAETYYFRCGDRGWGLKNKHRLEAGQFVNEYCGDLIDYDEYNRRLKKQNERGELDFYFCFLDSKRVIDAKPKGCHSRFMNHSCDPNCEGRLWTVNGDIRVGLFARHDIPPDTELTFNYNLDSIG